ESIEALLGWDERTYMPVAAGAYRAEQIAYLSGRVHERRTSPRIKEWLDDVADSDLVSDPHSDTATTIRQLRRDYDKRVKLPQRLVEELARASVLGQQIWVEARKDNNFRAFEPALKRMFELKREQAEAIGYGATRYDALLDDYEPDAKTADVAAALEGLRSELVPLVQAIVASHKK